jgi:hypothetical protein
MGVKLETRRLELDFAEKLVNYEISSGLTDYTKDTKAIEKCNF